MLDRQMFQVPIHDADTRAGFERAASELFGKAPEPALLWNGTERSTR